MLFGQDSLEGILDLLVPDEVLQQTGSLSQLRALRRQEVAESLPAQLPQVLENTVRSVTQTGIQWRRYHCTTTGKQARKLWRLVWRMPD